MDDTTLKPGGNVRYALTFMADGSLEIQANCNRGRGTWRSPDNVSLQLGPAAMTLAACPPSPLEERFVADLTYVRSYVMKNGHLFLSLMADAGIYEFEPVR